MLIILSLLFHIVHSGLILFNLIGWINPKTRKLHLIFVIIVFLSWVGLGLFYGLGYCPITDWHWHILLQMGVYDLPHSYVKYVFDAITGISSNAFLIDLATYILFLSSLALSIYFNFFREQQRKLAIATD
jgi:Protein of Unknown function (DUF2784)